MDSNLVKRILFAVVAIPLAFLVIWWGGWPLALVVALVAVLGSGELFAIAAKQDVRPLRRTGMLLAGAVPLVLQLNLTRPELLRGNAFHLFVMAIIAVLSLALLRRGVTEKPLAATSVTVLGVVYTGLLPSCLLLIRAAEPMQSWSGTWLVFFPLIVTWICDTAAMFGGRAFGRVKLAPSISPGKTREGGIAGVVGGMIVAAVFALVIFPKFDQNGYGGSLTLFPALLIGLVLSVIGQIGDLAESLFKREAGVKDSSTLIPGHGGVLDRFDSLYFVLPVAAFGYHLLGVI